MCNHPKGDWSSGDIVLMRKCVEDCPSSIELAIIDVEDKVCIVDKKITMKVIVEYTKSRDETISLMRMAMSHGEMQYVEVLKTQLLNDIRYAKEKILKNGFVRYDD